jgi:hypothetical protein
VLSAHRVNLPVPPSDLSRMSSDANRATHDDLWRTLQIVSEWIRTADTKAGATLAIGGAAARKYRFVTGAIQLLAGAMLIGALGLLLP